MTTSRGSAAVVTAAAFAWPFVLASRSEGGARVPIGRPSYRDVLIALAGTIAASALVTAVFGLDPLKGSLVVTAAILGVGSGAARFAVGRRLRSLRRRGHARFRAVLVGPAPSVEATVDRLAVDPAHPLNVVGACVEGDEATATVPVVGRIDGDGPVDDPIRDEMAISRVCEALAETRAGVVCLVPGSRFSGDRMRTLSWVLEDDGVELVTDLGLSDVAGHRMRLESLGAGALLHVRRAVLTGPRMVVKLATDRVLAALALVLLSPLMLVIAVAVRLSGPGPVIYRQVRVRRGGLLFTMLKFRTMHEGAHEQRADLVASADGDGPLFKMRQDPRITPIGRILRKYSLDELPQLFNVLRGEMSLVGPRPALPEEVASYEAIAHRRLRAIPGMTGLWQVSGRSNLSWNETLRLDLRYVDNWSLADDVRLLARTAGAVVRGTGAY